MTTSFESGSSFPPLPPGEGGDNVIRSARFIDVEIIGLLSAGEINADNITSGTLSADRIAVGSLDGDKITANTITADEIAVKTITAGEIAANTITATELNVTTLSAITATMGTLTIDNALTMGSVGLIRTSSGATRIEFRFDDPGEMRFYQSGAQSTNFGIIDSGNGLLAINSPFATSGNPTQILLSSVSNAMFLSIAGAERARLTTSGFRVVDGLVSAPSNSFLLETGTGMYRVGSNDLGFAVGGVQKMRITSTLFGAINVYSSTTGDAANINVNASGFLQRSTSARKYKSRINYNIAYLADYELKPAKFYRKDDKAWYLGFIADDLADENKLLGTYDDDGEVESYDLRAVVAVAVAKINRLEKQVEELTA